LVVAHRGLAFGVVSAEEQGSIGVSLWALGLPAQSVDGAIARRRNDPTGCAGRWARRWPAFGCLHECVLDAFLGEVDVAKHPDEDRHGAPVLLAEDAVDV
jgi:hypothetical protein